MAAFTILHKELAECDRLYLGLLEFSRNTEVRELNWKADIGRMDLLDTDLGRTEFMRDDFVVYIYSMASLNNAVTPRFLRHLNLMSIANFD